MYNDCVENIEEKHWGTIYALQIHVDYFIATDIVASDLTFSERAKGDW
jgi:hypothetical protein